MALPTVVINSAGSDTLASGAGPATAVTGTLAATHANTTVNITDAVDLSGVAVDGSAVLWVATSSGRRWSAISAISGTSGNWTVTVVTAYGTTESGKSWAIGGKRASLGGSLQLGLDCIAGWTIDVQTGETLTATWRLSCPRSVGLATTLTSTAPAYDSAGSLTAPKITTATNGVHGLSVDGGNIQVSHLWFDSTAASPGQGIVPASASLSDSSFSDVKVTGFNVGVNGQNSTFNRLIACVLDRCEVKNCTAQGVINTVDNVSLRRCRISGCVKEAVRATGNAVLALDDSVIDGNNTGGAGSGGVYYSSSNGAGNLVFCGNTVKGNVGPGLILESAAADIPPVMLTDNVFYGNTTYGVDAGASPALGALVNRNNAYGANSTAARRGIGPGVGDVTLTASPFVSSTDFGLNATAGGGAACKGAAATSPGASANPAGDVGAVPSGGGAGTLATSGQPRGQAGRRSFG